VIDIIFTWKDEFNLGVKSIDDQHKKLFDFLNRLHDIANRNDGFDHHDEIVQIFGELRDYTVYHFKYEEELMEKYGFDTQEAAKHIFEHDGFVRKVLQIQKENIDTHKDEVLSSVIDFGIEWITKHIFNTDKKYAELFVKNNVK